MTRFPDHRITRSSRALRGPPLPLPGYPTASQTIPDWRRVQGYRLDSSQFGVYFKAKASIGVGYVAVFQIPRAKYQGPLFSLLGFQRTSTTLLFRSGANFPLYHFVRPNVKQKPPLV